MKRPAEEIYQLKVTLKGARPPIWRRLLVGSDTSLSELNDFVIAAMGWMGYHMHAFDVAGRSFGNPVPELEMDDDSGITLGEIVRSGVTRFRHEYDFGDGWVHELRLEKTLPFEADARIPRVVAGRRACPPEDCGGVWGYANLLEVLADPAHPDHDEMKEWMAGDFDPEAFDLDAVNARLVRVRRAK